MGSPIFGNPHIGSLGFRASDARFRTRGVAGCGLAGFRRLHLTPPLHAYTKGLKFRV